MANGECQRLTTQFLGQGWHGGMCPKWGGEALNHFHGPNSVTHAVVGGHGSDSTMHDGVLVMSHMIYLTGAHSMDSMALVDTLHTKLTMHATVFLDSCFAGINGIAEMFSQKMPEHWVMGGVAQHLSMAVLRVVLLRSRLRLLRIRSLIQMSPWIPAMDIQPLASWRAWSFRQIPRVRCVLRQELLQDGI